MEQGVELHHLQKVIKITSRKEAIKTAGKMANANDIILIAGKGHETYQEVKGERSDFDDMKIVRSFLKLFKK
jgi:UDP-N-acetylmuramoyl-L-alanyl-D-glutamate--2,6-diaminopimelate ligase